MAPAADSSIEKLCTAIIHPVAVAKAFVFAFCVLALGCVAWRTEPGASSADVGNRRYIGTAWVCSLSGMEDERKFVHQVDMLVLGFSVCAMLHCALRRWLLREAKNDRYLLISLLALGAVSLSNALLAFDVTVNLCYTTETMPGQIRLVRPIKYIMGFCIAPINSTVVMGLFKELRVATSKFGCFVVAARVLAYGFVLLAATCVASSRDWFIFSVVMSLVSHVIPAKGYAVAFKAATRCFDEQTQYIMRLLPVIVAGISLPLAAIMCLGQAGVITWAQEEVATNVLITSTILLFFMLWGTRDADAAASKIDLELSRITSSSEAADARNDAKRKFMRYIFHELRVPLNAIALGLDDIKETSFEISAAAGDVLARCAAIVTAGGDAASARTPPDDAAPPRDSQGWIHSNQGHDDVVMDIRPANSAWAGNAATSDTDPSIEQGHVVLIESSAVAAVPPVHHSHPGLRELGDASAPVAPRLTVLTSARPDLLRVIEIAATDLRSAVKSADDVASTASMLRENATAMGKLLDDLLSLEKIEEGKLEIEPVEFQIRTLIDDATRLFAAPLAAKGLRLRIDIPTMMTRMVGDVHKLRQVLCNYISNAIKFSPHGARITVSVVESDDPPPAPARAPPVTVAVAPLPQPPKARFARSVTPSSIANVSSDSLVPAPVVPQGPILRFAVIDEGVGISKEDQANLFQPFNQIKAGALQKGNGTGLGLSICKRIIELSGGRVGCDATEGKGSIFWFEVPVEGRSASASAPTAAAAATAPTKDIAKSPVTSRS